MDIRSRKAELRFRSAAFPISKAITQKERTSLTGFVIRRTLKGSNRVRWTLSKGGKTSILSASLMEASRSLDRLATWIFFNDILVVCSFLSRINYPLGDFSTIPGSRRGHCLALCCQVLNKKRFAATAYKKRECKKDSPHKYIFRATEALYIHCGVNLFSPVCVTCGILSYNANVFPMIRFVNQGGFLHRFLLTTKIYFNVSITCDLIYLCYNNYSLTNFTFCKTRRYSREYNFVRADFHAREQKKK